MKIYLKAFLSSSITFGLLLGLMFILRDGLVTGLIIGSVGGISFGIFMSVVLVMSNKFYLKNNYPDAADHLDPTQVENTRINMKGKRLFKLCLESMSEIDAKVIYNNLEEGTIKAITMPHWKSLGEKVEVQLLNDANAPQNISVEIKSTPLFKFSAVDYGRSVSHITSITNFIDR